MGGLFDHDLIPLLFVLIMLANVFLDRRNAQTQAAAAGAAAGAAADAGRAANAGKA